MVWLFSLEFVLDVWSAITRASALLRTDIHGLRASLLVESEATSPCDNLIAMTTHPASRGR